MEKTNMKQNCSIHHKKCNKHCTEPMNHKQYKQLKEELEANNPQPKQEPEDWTFRNKAKDWIERNEYEGESVEVIGGFVGYLDMYSPIAQAKKEAYEQGSIEMENAIQFNKSQAKSDLIESLRGKINARVDELVEIGRIRSETPSDTARRVGGMNELVRLLSELKEVK